MNRKQFIKSLIAIPAIGSIVKNVAEEKSLKPKHTGTKTIIMVNGKTVGCCDYMPISSLNEVTSRESDGWSKYIALTRGNGKTRYSANKAIKDMFNNEESKDS